jgi:4-hydroxy-2-oxoheptanedioate aldolase
MQSLKSIWAEGRTALGAWVSLRDPLVAEVAGSAGFDYVCIDMQHGLSDLAQTMIALHAMAGGSAVPVVRVPWNEPGIIGRVLDAGALGVIIPMVNTPDDAKRAVEACRYAPDGARSFGPLTAGARYGGGYATAANETVACIPMIETRGAVECVDDILAVPGIDAVYIGPADLSLTYGLPPGLDNAADEFQSALKTVVAACERAGVVAGIHSHASLAGLRHGGGFRMITVSSDSTVVMQGLRSELKSARGAAT